MKYRGFEIKKEQMHYVLVLETPLDRGMEWREDTIEDAKREIDKFWDEILTSIALVHVDFGKEE